MAQELEKWRAVTNNCNVNSPEILNYLQLRCCIVWALLYSNSYNMYKIYKISNKNPKFIVRSISLQPSSESNQLYRISFQPFLSQTWTWLVVPKWPHQRQKSRHRFFSWLVKLKPFPELKWIYLLHGLPSFYCGISADYIDTGLFWKQGRATKSFLYFFLLDGEVAIHLF